MKIPLIVMARSKCTSPVIYIPNGQWTIESNHRESYVRLFTLNSPEGFQIQNGHSIQGDQEIQIAVEELKDKFVHIYASLNGTVKE